MVCPPCCPLSTSPPSLSTRQLPLQVFHLVPGGYHEVLLSPGVAEGLMGEMIGWIKQHAALAGGGGASAAAAAKM